MCLGSVLFLGKRGQTAVTVQLHSGLFSQWTVGCIYDVTGVYDLERKTQYNSSWICYNLHRYASSNSGVAQLVRNGCESHSEKLAAAE